MASWNPSPTIGGANWQGSQIVATKKQLLSSIAGLYADLQDLSGFTFNNLNVSTLTAENYISTPELYVSSIIGGGLQINNGFLQISTGDFSLVSLSTVSFKGIDLGGVNFSFDLGLGNAIGGFLGGLGAIVGGVTIGLGTGVGLGIQGITNGLFSLANTQGGQQINNNVYETVNGSTQIQISTLGNAFPKYSTIYRFVSSIAPNQVPGKEIFVSTLFNPNTVCIRSISDPLNPVTNDSNINTSTIQSYGQWVPFYDPTPQGEDLIARNAVFSTLTLYPPLGAIGIDTNANNAYSGDWAMLQIATMTPYSNSYNIPKDALTIATSPANYRIVTNQVNGNNKLNFISTTYSPYQSTIGTYGTPVYFITSTITSALSTIPQFNYTGTDFGGGNFAVCEPDESGFLSSATMDLIATSCNITFQWGLAVDNRNSTIAQGTAKRVTWNNATNTSNFINIPAPQSTLIANTQTGVSWYVRPFETTIETYAFPDNNPDPSAPQNGKAGIAFNVNRACFGQATTYLNQTGYPYQFNDNVFINGTIEADTFIAISSIINVSTNIQTFFSTQVFDADEATISSATITSFLNAQQRGYVSSLRIDEIAGGDISTFQIESYNFLNEFAFISTLSLDYQVLGYNATMDVAEGNFSTINTSTINTLNANVSTMNLSSFQQIGLTTIYNYPAALTAINTASQTTAPFVAIGFKARINLSNDNQTRVDYNYNQITGSSNGAIFYPLATFDPTQTIPNLWSVTNINSLTASTLNVNTISTTSHSGDNITANNITVFSNINFPSVLNGGSPITMTLSNTGSSNTFTPLQTNIIQGPSFPQQSNSFSITTSGSNTTFSDRQGFLFTLTQGDTVTFGGTIDDVILNSANFNCKAVKYGTSIGGFLQPRAFRQQTTTSFGSGQSINVNVQISDGSNTFSGPLYNLMTNLASFYVDNSAIAFNEVVLAPYIDGGTNTWYVNITARVNAGAAGADGTFSWNNLLFPYDMMT